MATRRKAGLERVLNSITALVLLGALYLVAVERVLPALRGRPARAVEGDRLTEKFRFQRLGVRDGAGAGRILEVPGGRAVLLLVYNSTCPACYANLDAWRRVLEATPPSVGILAVSLDRDERAGAEYARRHLPGIRAVAVLEPRRFAEALGVDVIPFTGLVDGEGVLAYARQGSLDSLAVRSLIRALGALQGSSTPYRKDGEG